MSARFQELSLEEHASCNYDSVAFYDGYDVSSPQIVKVCTVSPVTITSTGPSLFLVFSSDHSIHAGRFSLSWTFVTRSDQGVYYRFRTLSDSAKVFVYTFQAAVKLRLTVFLRIFSSSFISRLDVAINVVNFIYARRLIRAPFATNR